MTAGDAGVEQSLHLRLGRTAVEKDELQTRLPAQKCGQPACIDHGGLAGGGLQQQVVAIGMAAVVEDGDAVAVARILEDVEQRVQGDVLAQHHFAQAGLHGGVEHGVHLARLLGQVAQVAIVVAAIVGKG